MGLLSIFKRKGNGAAPSGAAAEPPEPVQEARTRARRRLVGAVVLVGIGVVGFPLVFETQPRPIPVDIQVDIPRKDGAAPLPMPPVARAPQPRAVTPAAPEIVTEDKGEAGKEVPAPASAPASASAPSVAAKPTPKPETSVPAPAPGPTPAPKPAPKPAPAPAPAPAKESARAQALLEGKDKPAAKPEAGRFVVQVGAYADAAAAREVRLKVEKTGLKTYTQVVETAQGKRIRVRVGPFPSREDAEKALAKASSTGLKAAVVPL